MPGADLVDDARATFVGGLRGAGQPVPELGVGRIQHVRECGTLTAIGFFVAFRQPPAQQLVELARTAAAAPAQAVEIATEGVVLIRHSMSSISPSPACAKRAGVRGDWVRASLDRPHPLPPAGKGKIDA